VAGDQAAYAGSPSPTRAVEPFASWLVSYQRYVYLRGTLLGVLLLAAAGGMVARRRFAGGLPLAFAVTVLLVPPMIADFDLRYLVPAVPAACLAAALAFAPTAGQRRCTTSPAATGNSGASSVADSDSLPGSTRTTSLPSSSTPTASPDTS